MKPIKVRVWWCVIFTSKAPRKKVKPPYVNHPECKNRHSKSKHIDADSNNQFRLEGFANKNTQLTLP